MGKNMEWTYKKEKNGGQWILILGCPLKEMHSLTDDIQDISGPTFADCAYCKYQEGTDYEVQGADRDYDATTVFPEKLKCGYKK